MAEVLIITVNFRGADSTVSFLKCAVQLECFESAHVIVVENGSCDGSAECLRPIVARLDNVELLESDINRGYFGGANWALQQYLARDCKPGWVIICNNDIVFDDRQFLLKLLRRDPDCAQVIAPAIIASQTSLDSNPFLRQRPTVIQLWGYQFWYSNYYLMWLKQLLSPYIRILRRHIYFWRRKSKPGDCVKIYAAHGSFMIFSRSYFEAGGYIDDGFFLYAEEFTVAEICLRLGLKVIHDTALKVWHSGRRTTGRKLNRFTFEHARRGLDYALKKYLHETDSGKWAKLGRLSRRAGESTSLDL